jgi:hypothetical protein
MSYIGIIRSSCGRRRRLKCESARRVAASAPRRAWHREHAKHIRVSCTCIGSGIHCYTYLSMRATYLMLERSRPERFVSEAEGLTLERTGDACRARSGVCVSDWKLHKCYATHSLGWVSVRSTRRSGQVRERKPGRGQCISCGVSVGHKNEVPRKQTKEL